MHGWGASIGRQTAGRMLAGMVATALLAGCNPVAPDPSAATEPRATPTARGAAIGPTCETLAAVYAEPAAIGHAFETLIAGDVDLARSQAAAARTRLAAVVDAMPIAAPGASPAPELAGPIESTAELLLMVVDILDPRTGDLDRLRALQDGEAVLGMLDWSQSLAGSNSRPSTLCPGVAYVSAAVVFPPRPSPSAFGLPDVVKGFAFKVWIADPPFDIGESLRAAGADPSAVRYLRGETVDGQGYGPFDVLDPVSITPKALIEGLSPEWRQGLTKRRTSVTVNGFDVVRYGSLKRGESSLTAAVRGDRAILFEMEGFDDLKDVLEAMP